MTTDIETNKLALPKKKITDTVTVHSPPDISLISLFKNNYHDKTVKQFLLDSALHDEELSKTACNAVIEYNTMSHALELFHDWNH